MDKTESLSIMIFYSLPPSLDLLLPFQLSSPEDQAIFRSTVIDSASRSSSFDFSTRLADVPRANFFLLFNLYLKSEIRLEERSRDKIIFHKKFQFSNRSWFDIIRTFPSTPILHVTLLLHFLHKCINIILPDPLINASFTFSLLKVNEQRIGQSNPIKVRFNRSRRDKWGASARFMLNIPIRLAELGWKSFGEGEIFMLKKERKKSAPRFRILISLN